jgi:hypothetical protein
MARWAGWGAGPAGAGAAGGPSRAFLWIVLVACVVVAVGQGLARHYGAAAVAAAGVVYFAARLFGGLGRPSGKDER